jgi:hypothetical protein
VLFGLPKGADGGGGYPLSPGTGGGQLAGADLAEVEQGDPAIGRMRAAGDQAAAFQAVGHVGDAAR